MPDIDPKVREVLIDLSEGNPGAVNVLVSTYFEVGIDRFLPFARALGERGIRGSQIWCSFKDDHGQDIEAFVRANTIPERQALVKHTKEQDYDGS